jgi:predicted ABC-type ATPase
MASKRREEVRGAEREPATDHSPDAILKAAEWTRNRREELLTLGAGIAFETVLSTDEKIEFLARAKDAGFHPRLLHRDVRSQD